MQEYLYMCQDVLLVGLRAFYGPIAGGCVDGPLPVHIWRGVAPWPQGCAGRQAAGRQPAHGAGGPGKWPHPWPAEQPGRSPRP
jgi:hypothetical protein